MRSFLLSLCLLLAVCAHGEKQKCLWFDASANYARFCHQDSVCYYLDKTRDTGFNTIVLDVRPCDGRVLYRKTRRQPRYVRQDCQPDGDWDYLQFFIDECHRRGMKIIVSTTLFTGGSPHWGTGMINERPKFAKYASMEWTPQGMKDIREDKEQVAVFLNPAHPKVQQNALEIIREIVGGYDIDGYALDYCRYGGIQTDFSDYSRRRFEKYIGHRVQHWPQDIFDWRNGERVDGPLAQAWFTFRAKVIHDFLAKARKEIKRIKPQLPIHYWAASWYPGLYTNGQNWASKRYDPHGEHQFADEAYHEAGFADQIDVFQLGAYLTVVDDSKNPESMAFAIERAKRLLKGDCYLYASFMTTIDRSKIADATALCLRETEGLMIFDIVHVINLNTWELLREGIRRGEQ